MAILDGSNYEYNIMVYLANSDLTGLELPVRDPEWPWYSTSIL